MHPYRRLSFVADIAATGWKKKKKKNLNTAMVLMA